MCKCCGVVGILLRLFCRMRCRGTVVASALTFYPPNPPFYSIEWDDTDAAYKQSNNISRRGYKRAKKLVLSPDLPFHGDDPEVFAVPSEMHSICVWIYRHPNPRAVILYSHGNATDNGGMHMSLTELYHNLQCTVVGYDYSGYGASSGAPTESSTYKNIDAVFHFLQSQQIVRDAAVELIAYGESVGSGPSVWLAKRYKLLGLVLHAPIASGLRVITDSRLPRRR